jgi:hypothetical protein
MDLNKSLYKIKVIFPEQGSQKTAPFDHGQRTLKLVDTPPHQMACVLLKFCGQVTEFRFPVQQFSHSADGHSFIRVVQ